MKKGFTVLEMILVLSVITIIVLLTIPNIAQKRQIIDDIGCDALLETINGQILTYQLNGGIADDIEKLVKEGYLTDKQTKCPNGKKVKIVDGQAQTQ